MLKLSASECAIGFVSSAHCGCLCASERVPCLACHNKIAAMRHHELIGKSEMATRGPTQDLLPLPNSRCAVHPEEALKMYCRQDDVVCCTVCIAEDHR